MPTVEELAAQLTTTREQLAVALERIERLEERATIEEHLFTIRRVVVSNKSDIAGLAEGQARLERAVAGLIIKAEAADERIGALSERVAGHDQRFDSIDARLAGHDERFDRIDARLDAHDTRFDRIDGTLAEILRRLPG